MIVLCTFDFTLGGPDYCTSLVGRSAINCAHWQQPDTPLKARHRLRRQLENCSQKCKMKVFSEKWLLDLMWGLFPPSPQKLS